jgi:hypothetical protein
LLKKNLTTACGPRHETAVLYISACLGFRSVPLNNIVH